MKPFLISVLLISLNIIYHANKPMETKGNKELLTELIGKCVTNDDCLEYPGKGAKGYPQIRINGSKQMARRVVWECANDKEIPEDMFVKSVCGNRKCCNPDHLSISNRRFE